MAETKSADAAATVAKSWYKRQGLHWYDVAWRSSNWQCFGHKDGPRPCINCGSNKHTGMMYVPTLKCTVGCYAMTTSGNVEYLDDVWIAAYVCSECGDVEEKWDQELSPLMRTIRDEHDQMVKDQAMG